MASNSEFWWRLTAIASLAFLIMIPFGAMRPGSDRDNVPLKYTDIWVEVYHESGTKYMLRKSAIIGFKYTDNPEIGNRNQVIYGGRAINTELDLHSFEQALDIKDEDIRQTRSKPPRSED